MRPTVTFSSVDCQFLLEDEKYQYLIDNLGEPLPLATVWWGRDGSVDHFAVYMDDEEIIVIFNTNKPKGEFWNGIKFQFGKKKMHSHI